MFKFVKAMAGVAQDDAAVQDCGCGCSPRKTPETAVARDGDEDCPCCGTITRSNSTDASATGDCGCGPRKPSLPNGVPSCGSDDNPKPSGCSSCG